MDLSVFLGRVFGLYLTLMGVVYIARQEFLKEAINDFFKSPGLLLSVSIFTVILGLLVVVGHNVWEPNWRVIITVLGYLTLFKGVWYLYSPYSFRSLADKMLDGNTRFYIGGLNILLGIYLFYLTF